MVEDSLIKAATSGQLKGKVSYYTVKGLLFSSVVFDREIICAFCSIKVTEGQLIVLLNQIDGDSDGAGGSGVGGRGKKVITMQRRKYGIDDDDDDDDSDLL